MRKIFVCVTLLSFFATALAGSRTPRMQSSFKEVAAPKTKLEEMVESIAALVAKDFDVEVKVVLIRDEEDLAYVTRDGTIYIDTEFVQIAPRPVVEFVLAHEIAHLVLGHVAARIPERIRGRILSNFEAEADSLAAEYMLRNNKNLDPVVSFFYGLSLAASSGPHDPPAVRAKKLKAAQGR